MVANKEETSDRTLYSKYPTFLLNSDADAVAIE